MSSIRMVAVVAAAFALGLSVGPLDGSGPTLLALCLAGVSGVVPGAVWTSWSLAPATLMPLVAALAVHAVGVLGQSRAGRPVSAGRLALFGAGWLLLAVALVSPLCRLAANLAWAHMVQHVILVALAPPLLLLGGEGVWWSTRARPPADARADPAWHLRPAVTALPYGAAIWAWHVPRLYEAALLDGPLHLLMIASLVAASLLFWRSILVAATRGSAHALMAVPVLLATVVHTGMLGALLAFSSGLWFSLMAPGALAFGLSPLDDQQLAGLIMWVPMGLIYVVAALAVVASGLAGPDRAVPDRSPDPVL